MDIQLELRGGGPGQPQFNFGNMGVVTAQGKPVLPRFEVPAHAGRTGFPPNHNAIARRGGPGITTKDRRMTTSEEIEGRVRAALEELGIAGWDWIEIDPQYGDTAEFCQQYGYDLPHSANTIIVARQAGTGGLLRRNCAGVRPAGRQTSGCGG